MELINNLFSFFGGLHNEVYWFIYLVVSYFMILIAFRFWGKIGLFIFIPISIIIANIQVQKLMDLFGVVTTMGNIAYGGIFIVEDILSENYGKKIAQKTVAMGFFSMIFTTIIMTLALKINPSTDDMAQGALEMLFGSFGRLTVASMLAYVVSSTTDIHLYQLIRKYIPSFGSLWIRNNASTLISQVLDNIVFTLVAFYGVYEWPIIISIMFSTYFLKVIISILDTPFVYIATYWKKKGIIKELGENNN